jgi:hypothetical protein
MDLHVVPTWQPHEVSPTCWCGPRNDVGPLNPDAVWVHRLANDGPAKIDPEADPGPALGGWIVVEE